MNPIEQFSQWFTQAKAHPAIADATAMALATADAAGTPSVRIVLLKEFDARGFAFYTNLESRKSRELKQNPQAALCFHWVPLERQVRIEGKIEPVSDAEADAYFATRPRESQIGAWASKQSQPLADMAVLQQAVAETAARFAGQPVPRPPFWSGWRVIPQRIEFWQQGDFRLHERQVFTRQGEGWDMERLYP